MRWLILVGSLLLSSTMASAQMVRSDTIGNDPAKEKLCASRVESKDIVPFDIDARYVARA